jgi:hypothetical protein
VLLRHHKLPPEIKEKLDQMLTIKPKSGIELAVSKEEQKSPKETLLEVATTTESEPVKKSEESKKVLLSLPEPKIPETSPIITEITPSDEELMKRVAQENLSETAEKTMRNISHNLPKETKVDILVKNIQDKQQELVSQGNLMAADADVVLNSLVDAAVKEPQSVKETIAESAAELTGKNPNVVKKHIHVKEKTIEAILPPSGEPLALPEPTPAVPIISELEPEEVEKKSPEKASGLRRSQRLRRAQGLRKARGVIRRKL